MQKKKHFQKRDLNKTKKIVGKTTILSIVFWKAFLWQSGCALRVSRGCTYGIDCVGWGRSRCRWANTSWPWAPQSRGFPCRCTQSHSRRGELAHFESGKYGDNQMRHETRRKTRMEFQHPQLVASSPPTNDSNPFITCSCVRPLYLIPPSLGGRMIAQPGRERETHTIRCSGAMQGQTIERRSSVYSLDFAGLNSAQVAATSGGRVNYVSKGNKLLV